MLSIDMFFYPPKKTADVPAHRHDVIRIRRTDGVFTIYFYNEVRSLLRGSSQLAILTVSCSCKRRFVARK
jgi:hypothetical protein